MTHLSRGLLAGLQDPHMSSLDTSMPLQQQPSLGMQTSQAAARHPYGALPHSGAYNMIRPPMVIPFTELLQDQCMENLHSACIACVAVTFKMGDYHSHATLWFFLAESFDSMT